MARFSICVVYLTLLVLGIQHSMFCQEIDKEGPKRENVYFISGLGADERVFARLNIDSSYNVHYVQWLRPKRKESLSDYASRMIAQIDTTQPFHLVGYSFGGIIARELAKYKAPQQIILVSSQTYGVSISKFNQLLISVLIASPLAPMVLKNPGKATYKRFGAQSVDEKKLLKSILKETDTRFLRWAVRHLTRWKGSNLDVKIYQIHGSADLLISPTMVQPDTMLTGGTHMMIYSMSDEVGAIINRELNRLQ